jgi:pSer/pThr/pTyr-binding forkhead associated (FHA) protein
MIQVLLLVGQALVLVLLYVFVWRVMRTARTDVLAPEQTSGRRAVEDSTIIPAADVARARREAGLAEPRIVVVSSERLRVGTPFVIGDGLTIGRANDNHIVLDDSTVSAHHARMAPPDLLVDLGSTNGTLVNGRSIAGQVRVAVGDTLAVGSTTFRYEVAQ